MSFLSEIKYIKSRHLLSVTLGFLSLVGPGLLMIYEYRPQYLEQFDVLKLLLFSTALTMPVFLLNVIAASLTNPRSEKTPLFEAFLVGSMLTSVMLYTCLVVAHLRNLTFREMVFYLVLMAPFMWLMSYIVQREDGTKKSGRGREKHLGQADSLR